MERVKERWGLTLMFFFLISGLFTYMVFRDYSPIKTEAYFFNELKILGEEDNVLYNYHSYHKAQIKKAQFEDESKTTYNGNNIPEVKKNFIYHKVKSGETLWKIAKIYNVPLTDLIKFNNIENPDLIFQGSLLKIITES